jgi:hypothetical protein
MITLWDESKVEMMITSDNPNSDVKIMMKSVIRDGLFSEDGQKIMRVNEIEIID